MPHRAGACAGGVARRRVGPAESEDDGVAGNKKGSHQKSKAPVRTPFDGWMGFAEGLRPALRWGLPSPKDWLSGVDPWSRASPARGTPRAPARGRTPRRIRPGYVCHGYVCHSKKSVRQSACERTNFFDCCLSLAGSETEAFMQPARPAETAVD